MSDLYEQVEPIVAPMRTQLLDLFQERVGPLIGSPWADLDARIDEKAKVLEETNAFRVEDPQHALFVKMSCLILALYRALETHFEKRQALIDLMQQVTIDVFFSGGIEAYLERRLGITPDAPASAWEKVCTEFKARGEEQFGRAWQYEQSIKDQRRCFINITKCGYADFFIDQDARELLYILCVADYVWADALEKYGIRFERPTILAEGSDACRFQFFKS